MTVKGQAWVKVNQSKAVRSSIGAGHDFYNDDILGLNWSTTSDDAGFWNIRIIVDAEEVLEESDENNNAEWTWHYYYGEYFELEAQRPDLIVTVIDEGTNKVYQDVGRTIKVGVSQSELGEEIAENAEVHIKIKNPDLTVIDWFKIDESKTVGFNGDTIFFNYTWTPTQIGAYELYAYVDRDDEILEWNEDNNQYESDKYIEVFEKFSDLQVTNIEITPLDDDGYALVGLSSEITATIGNFGVRDMTGEEGSNLEVTFYTSAPFASELATVNVETALIIGETMDVSIPFTFIENDQYLSLIHI